jgi:hypothetical protein
VLCITAALSVASCGDDDDEITAAERLGVGRQCATNDDCPEDEETGERLSCLTTFKGGYCGRTPCSGEQDCPFGSACVTHEGANYCFLICGDKPDCNRFRDLDEEANCSSNVTLVGTTGNPKTCVPPSSG